MATRVKAGRRKRVRGFKEYEGNALGGYGGRQGKRMNTGGGGGAALAKRLRNGEESSSKSKGNDGFMLTPDPRARGLKTALTQSWSHEFVKPGTEGQAGKDQASLLGSGPRKLIHSLDKVLVYRTRSTTCKRKSRIRRLFESGQSDAAFRRMRLHSFRGVRGIRPDPKYFVRLRAGKNGMDTLATQTGLSHQSKENLKKKKKQRRYDSVL